MDERCRRPSKYISKDVFKAARKDEDTNANADANETSDRDAEADAGASDSKCGSPVLRKENRYKYYDQARSFNQ